ncbi:hypothetical protein NDU88_003628 [Pleurodeles waltl]|uniref:Uncharacterized protein n=1 Tax=Pleurodeles waltl TaxID=8319 RepID=A0AAV7W5X8_PLEWA|nr:hypothetical protein NDU88_003628 [Pleurodeles waltl]
MHLSPQRCGSLPFSPGLAVPGGRHLPVHRRPLEQGVDRQSPTGSLGGPREPSGPNASFQKEKACTLTSSALLLGGARLPSSGRGCRWAGMPRGATAQDAGSRRFSRSSPRGQAATQLSPRVRPTQLWLCFASWGRREPVHDSRGLRGPQAPA